MGIDANSMVRAFDPNKLTISYGGAELWVIWKERISRIEHYMAKVADEKEMLNQTLRNGRTWARIMTGDKEAIGRIGMVTLITTDNGKVLASVMILSRRLNGNMGEYLWGASWTRQFYPIEHLEFFMLPGSGYTVWVPKMVWNGQLDGGCHVDPSKWIWYGRYSGPQIGEGAGMDEEYEATPGL